MKQLFVLLLAIMQISLNAQIRSSEQHINSGAYSLNTNCGIGEIFINPTEKVITPIVKDPETIGFFKVYPNPVYDLLYLTSSIPLTEVSIFSLDGKLIKTQDVSQILFVDMIDIPKGMYLLVAKNSEFIPVKILKN